MSADSRGSRAHLRYPVEARASSPRVVTHRFGSRTLDPKVGNRVGIVVIDDHALTRMGLKVMVASQRDMRFLGEAEDIEGALTAMKPARPDVVLINTTLAGRDNGAILRSLARSSPQTRILAFGPRDGDEEIAQLLEAGAVGYVLETAAVSEMAFAIREAHAGRGYLSSRVQAQLDERRRWPVLTGRQRDVLALLAEGRTNAGIAAVLNISAGTVKLHIKSILRKLGVEDRTRAVVVALRRGFARIS